MNRQNRAFLTYHEDNPHVYKMFARFANEVAARGRLFYGAHAVMERMRWYTSIETFDPQNFKINNTYSPYYARMFMSKHPKLINLFELRDAAADELFPALIARRNKLKERMKRKTLRKLGKTMKDIRGKKSRRRRNRGK